MTRPTTARSTAARIQPSAPAGVRLTTDNQATGSDHRLQNPESTPSHGTFEQLRLW